MRLLDTNIISDLVRNPQGRAANRLQAVGDTDVVTSVIVAGELRYGCPASWGRAPERANTIC